jgi:hypothetical protein
VGRTPHPDQSIASWRNGNAAVCKTAMSGVGTRRRIHFVLRMILSETAPHPGSSPGPAFSGSCADALVARMERRPSSKRVHAGSNPAESASLES